MKKLLDSTWKSACEAPTEENLERFYLTALGRVRQLCFSRAYSPEWVDDAVQMVFCQLFEEIRGNPREMAREDASALIAMTATRVRDVMRKRWARAVQRHVPFSVADGRVLGSGDIRDEIVRKQQELLLQKTIYRLSPRWRIPLELRYVQGLKYGEMAAVLGMSVSATYKQVIQARRVLENSLKQRDLERRASRDVLCQEQQDPEEWMV